MGSEVGFLLSFLDDESDSVRNRAIAELATLGDGLSAAVQPFVSALSPDQHAALQSVFLRQRQEWLQRLWPTWQVVSGRKEQVELALSLLARFQLGIDFPLDLSDLLDGLAAEYRDQYRRADVVSLARFLFDEKQLAGNREDYHNPLNSNLISVLLSKRGIPISLAQIYILVGGRLGLDIEGCNVPRHFLARAIQGDRTILVDCFERGRIVEIEKLIGSTNASSRQLETLRRGTSATRTLQRVLQNLSQCYTRSGDRDLSRFMVELMGSFGRH
jgi:hypothetical protein